jgi:hypothetical protein
MRIPKLRGFKNRFKIEYEVVNVGAIGALAERGAFEVEARQVCQGAPITINQDILRASGSSDARQAAQDPRAASSGPLSSSPTRSPRRPAKIEAPGTVTSSRSRLASPPSGR